MFESETLEVANNLFLEPTSAMSESETLEVANNLSLEPTRAMSESEETRNICHTETKLDQLQCHVLTYIIIITMPSCHVQCHGIDNL